MARTGGGIPPVMSRFQDHFRPTIFGLADGMMSLLGVILYLLGHQDLIFLTAVSGAITSALSMGGSEFMSDSDNGFSASAIMGAATGIGAILPALPFAFMRGTPAFVLMIVISFVIAVFVGWIRAKARGKKITVLSVGSTVLLFAIIIAVGSLVTVFLPGGAG